MLEKFRNFLEAKKDEPKGYDAVDMLRATIDTICSEAPEDGETDSCEFGLEIIYDIADQIPVETVEVIIDALFDWYGVDDEDVLGTVEPKKQEDLAEELSAVQRKRLYYLRKKRKEQQGSRTDTEQFKRKYYFDSDKRRFVKRDTELSTQDMRNKRRAVAKTGRKNSTHAKGEKTRKKLSHIKDPYDKDEK